MMKMTRLHSKQTHFGINTDNKAFPNLTDAYWTPPAGRHIIKIHYAAI